MRHQITIAPRDVLFFRDARPMGGSFEGAGATWPLPGVLYSAMRSALLAEWPEGNPEFESVDHKYTDREEQRKTTALFGGLQTIGPFPQRNEVPLFPLPLDVEDGGVMQPTATPGTNNLPPPLKYAVANTRPPSKKDLGNWMSLAELNRYLNGETLLHAVRNEELFTKESRPGVGIDPDTHANEQGIFYQAEYLRLNNETDLTVFAECTGTKRGGESGGDVLDTFFAEKSRRPLILGGQRGVACARARRAPETIAKPAVKGDCVKWVLLTPALFNAGWLPGWVDSETGRVRLKGECPARNQFKTRRDWREAINNQPDIAAELVAARIGKAVTVSGWKLDKDTDSAGGGPKPTRLLVPAGSVYYFKCDSEKDAQNLAETLHAQVKSDQLGEQGYGFGVCGNWHETGKATV